MTEPFLTTPAKTRRFANYRTGSVLGAAALCLGVTASTAKAQSAASLKAYQSPAAVEIAAPAESSSLTGSAQVPVLDAANVLPEAPVPQIGAPKPVNAGVPGQAPVAPLRSKFIPAGYAAQRLGVKGKLEVGATDLYSWEDAGAVILSAGYEHALNSQPNYGTDKGAFGERVGAAALREASQGIFTDMVFSSLLHQDPRYYQLGPSHNVVRRTLYAVTRPLITRTDSGRETINGSLLLGYGAAAALTPTYYPQINRNFHDTVSTYGGSIGGAALGFFVSEFSTDVLTALHLSHNP